MLPTDVAVLYCPFCLGAFVWKREEIKSVGVFNFMTNVLCPNCEDVPMGIFGLHPGAFNLGSASPRTKEFD